MEKINYCTATLMTVNNEIEKCRKCKLFTRGDRRRNRSAQPVGATIAPTVAATIASCKQTITMEHFLISLINLTLLFLIEHELNH